MDLLTRLLPGSLLALVLVAAGCGAEADPGDGVGDPPPPQAPATSLQITVWPSGEGQGEEQTYTLACDPPSGTHPSPAAACAALADLGAEALDPVPADVLCTQIYGGPAQAHVQGTVDGEHVDARLSLTDGCEIARWEALEQVVPRPNGGLA